MSSMEKEYRAKKGEQVFYASKNKGTITGVEGKKKHIARKMKRDPNDSDSLKEYSRRDPQSGRPIFRMPEGVYKHKGDKYIKEDRKQESVIHG